MSMQITEAAHYQSLHMTSGKSWPADAVYCAEYRTRTWPMGWDSEYSVEFFRDKKALSAWKAAQEEWACMDGNGLCLDMVYEWDLGPQRRPEMVIGPVVSAGRAA